MKLFKSKESIKYYVLNVQNRNEYLHSNEYSGGFAVTVKFVKTITNWLGGETVLEKTVTFDNWHSRKGKFTFFSGDSGNDGWNLLLNDDCETFKFAYINTEWLREQVDKYAERNGITLRGSWQD